MNFSRRSFVASGLATSSLPLLPSKLFAADTPLPTAPVPRFLEKTFTPLSSALLPHGQWRPFPTIEDRAGWQALPEEVRSTLVKNADAALEGEWPQLTATLELEYHRTGNRSHYEGLNSARRSRLSTLVLGECVTNQGKYLDQIANGIWLICEETSWSYMAHLGDQQGGAGLPNITDPLIDLFAAETGAQLAAAYYLLGDKLDTVSPLLRERIRIEQKRRIIDVFEKRDHWWLGLYSHRQNLNNWTPWINSNVLTVILFLEPDQKRREQLVLKSCRSLDAYLADVSPDGGCDEGPGYWGRAAASLLDSLEILVSGYNGKGAEVLRTPYMRAAGRFIVDTHIAKNLYVNYGDGHMTDAPEAELVYRFGRATGDDLLINYGHYLRAQRGTPAIGNTSSRGLRSLFIGKDIAGQPGSDVLVKDSWYPALGLMTARIQEQSADGFYLALQAASNGRSHAHNDSGSVIVFLNGNPVFIDAGVGQYTAQTFSPNRYKIWTMQSAFHNLPTVGGVQQHNGAPFRAKVLDYRRGDATTSLTVDLAPAYPAEAGIKTWKRTATLDRGTNRVLLNEEFQLAKAVPVELSFMTMVEPAISEGQIRVGDAILEFPARDLAAKADPIPDLDASLTHAFPGGLWRIQLHSKADTSTATWRLEIRKA